MKKLVLIVMVGLFSMTMAGCGATGAESQAEAAETATAQIANPWRDTTEEEAVAYMPNLFGEPEGATNVRWSVMGDPEDLENSSPLVQMDFDLDGQSFTAREQYPGEENAGISGMYYEWTVSDDVTLANWCGGFAQGKNYRYVGENEYVDLITWYDLETGANYSLSCVAADLDGFDIQAVAEAIYDPENQESAKIPD